MSTPSTGMMANNGHISSRIQQLLNTLKRPKNSPSKEFFVDDEDTLETIVQDPNRPLPTGPPSEPELGEPFGVVSNWPSCLEAAVCRWGTQNTKAPCITTFDMNGKVSSTLSYGKLWSRSRKLAFTLLNKLGTKQDPLLKAGQRVALVYSNSEPTTFVVAFYACLFSGLIPVPVEVPRPNADAGSQQIGFLLRSCNVTVALTSELCQKCLLKTPSGETVELKGWPKVFWVTTDSKIVAKPPKDWSPRLPDANNETAYIEYKTSKDGSVLGVEISRLAMLAHCHALSQGCRYTQGETLVNVLEFKRGAGLWHAMLTGIMNMMHIVCIPYAVMKVNSLYWIQKIHSYKATMAIAKSQELRWSVTSFKEQKDLALGTLRMLVVADGACPWSLAACDAFLKTFHSKGLKAEAICPCASSPETLTLSIRRPLSEPGGTHLPTGRTSLSMFELSHGVIQAAVASDGTVQGGQSKQSLLVLQDSGCIMPGVMVCVVKIEGPPKLCRVDEVGELCINSSSTGSSYYGLPSLTKQIFELLPVNAVGAPFCENSFVRSGLLGFMGMGGNVFVVGREDSMLNVIGRRHGAEDIVATAMAVQPSKVLNRGRLVVFSVPLLRDERAVVVTEQTPHASDEDTFQWMTHLIQAVETIHQLNLYSVMLVPADSLPRFPLGVMDVSEVRRRFTEGSLHPSAVLMCPHSSITNLPQARERRSDVGMASMMLGKIVTGKRIAAATGKLLVQSVNEAGKFRFHSEMLQWRAQTTPEHILFTQVGSKGFLGGLTCSQLHKRAEKVAAYLADKERLSTGDHVALLYPSGLELIVAFYGCLYAGCIPVPICAPIPQALSTILPSIKLIVEVSRVVRILTTQALIKMLKSKEALSTLDIKSLPTLIDTDDLPKRKLSHIYKPPTSEMLAYVDFGVSMQGVLTGLNMSHAAAMAMCCAIQTHCDLTPLRHVTLCIGAHTGLGLVLWCLSSVYTGHQTFLISPAELETLPYLWLLTLSQHKTTDTFCSGYVAELCTKNLSTQIGTLKTRGVNLASLRSCIVVSEERPRFGLLQSFTKIFEELGLAASAMGVSFGCQVNVAIGIEAPSATPPTTVYIDIRALRSDRIRLMERGAPHSLPIMQAGQLLPGTQVVIVCPESLAPVGDLELGEVWVQSPCNGTGFEAVIGPNPEARKQFHGRLSVGDTQSWWVRSGYLGFLHHVANAEPHDDLYVVGSIEEALDLRGMRYYPVDIEGTVVRAHKNIVECVVFEWKKLLVVVAEFSGPEAEVLDVVPLATGSVLEEHHLVAGVVVVTDPGTVPINPRGEKQRMLLRDHFLNDSLDPLAINYNM
uniref:disco-interacting protein 2 homolog C-like n=1 Tax=Myxine glutinosa TaxID=7769 RepID=UPI00358FAC1C